MMATAKQCRLALEALARRFGEMDHGMRQAFLVGRTVCLNVPDLGVTFLSRVAPEAASPILQAYGICSSGQIRVTAHSDDVLAIAKDPGSLAPAWHSGRLKIEGSFVDMLLLRRLIRSPQSDRTGA